MPRWPVPGPAPGAIRIRPDQARAASQLDNFSKARLAGPPRVMPVELGPADEARTSPFERCNLWLLCKLSAGL